jgi:GNAT superfamily N-acetyltransferase
VRASSRPNLSRTKSQSHQISVALSRPAGHPVEMLRIAPLTDDRAAFEIDRAAAEVDSPDIPFGSFEAYRARLRHPWPGSELEQFLAVRDGVGVGHLALALPQLDNVANVNLELVVHPGHRRRGTGRALIAFAVERAGALGRRHIIGETGAGAGASFAAAVGAAPGLVEIRSRLELGAAEPADTPVAPGYRLVRWTGVAPEEYVDDLGYLDSRLNVDAPVGDLALEPEKVDAARIRAAEAAHRVRHRVAFHTGAVHEGSGRLVAWTLITSRDDVPRHAWQLITIVDPGHRGHGLGLAIKNQNLRYVRSARPAVRVIDTYNAAGNVHMLRINRLMGFRKVDQVTLWQLTV